MLIEKWLQVCSERILAENIRRGRNGEGKLKIEVSGSSLLCPPPPSVGLVNKNPCTGYSSPEYTIFAAIVECSTHALTLNVCHPFGGCNKIC